MDIARDSESGVVVVAPIGRIDARGAAKLAARLEAAASARPDCLVVDMSDVSYIGSKGLQVLLAALFDARSSDGELRLAGVCANVLHILEIIHFDRLFTICDSVEDAVTARARVLACCG